MKCPVCGEHSPDSWRFLDLPYTGTTSQELGGSPQLGLDGIFDRTDDKWRTRVSVDFMRCANNTCGELVMRVHESTRTFMGGVPIPSSEVWIVRPRGGDASRPVDSLVPSEFRRDFEEAAIILDRSPRMAAVLARRLLADLLERYAGRTEYGLAARIDEFNKDERQPAGLRKNLHILREMGDFSAHTQKDDQAEIIDVDRDEAKWTLDVIERLFDHFIVTPAQDEKIRKGMEEKMEQADRRPIKPLPGEEQGD